MRVLLSLPCLLLAGCSLLFEPVGSSGKSDAGMGKADAANPADADAASAFDAAMDPDANPGTNLQLPVSAASDDAEENLGTGTVSTTSVDLELGFDGAAKQQVGLRFVNVAIPSGSTITGAYIQFTASNPNSGATHLDISAQSEVAPTTFASTNMNLSSRPRSTLKVPWDVPGWPDANESLAIQRTPDLSALVSEAIKRSGWSAGSSLVFLLDGTGTRTARSKDSGSGAPVLHVFYQ